MKKRTNSLIALVLTLALVIAIGIPGIAAGIGIFPADDNRYTIQPVKHYDTYTVFGDSITAGVNCNDYYRYYNEDGTYVSSGSFDSNKAAQYAYWDRGDNRRVEGTYPALVEDMISADTVHHFSRIGYRSDELRILLDNDYYGDDLTPTLLEFLGETYSVDIDGWIKNRPAFQQAAADADIITLGIGSNDILMTVWFNAIGMLYGENASLGTIMNAIGSVAQSTQDPTNMMSAVLQLMNGAFGATKTLAELAQAMLEAEIDFRTNFKAITDRIYELNPDVELVVVGIYNGAKEIRVSKDIDLQAGKLGDAAFMAINNYIANLCPNRTKYKYVDVWNITLGAAPSLFDMIQNLGLIGTLMTVDHPTETGHAEIAKEIRAVLPKDGTNDSASEPAKRVVKKAYDDNWYCFLGDKIDTTFSGIAQNKFGWWKCTDGKVTFKETGIFENEFGKWYCKNSKVDFTKNGKVRFNGETYTVVRGRVV